MGSDKGLLHMQTDTWTQRAGEKIRSLGLSLVISVNPSQVVVYQSQLPDYDLVPDNLSLSLRGPLAGLLSVHLLHPKEDLLVLACDMPVMETGILKELISYYERFPKHDAFVYTILNEPEPLCAIYKTSCLSHIINLYQSNELPKHSMKYMLEHSLPYFIPATPEQQNCFRNINTHAELNGL